MGKRPASNTRRRYRMMKNSSIAMTFRLRRTPETDPRTQELGAILKRENKRRNGWFEHLEKFGLDRVKHDLLNGGFRVVGGTLDQQEEAWEWVRMKESQATTEKQNAATGAVLFIAISRIEELRRLSSPD